LPDVNVYLQIIDGTYKFIISRHLNQQLSTGYSLGIHYITGYQI